jgi:MFS transporter, FHS family, glucose/mannose:H+ symporter
VRLNLGIVHIGFALTGIVTTLLGPLLPLLTVAWQLNDAQAGRLFIDQFVLSVTGATIAAKVVSRWGAARAVPAGMFMIAVGLLGLAAANTASAGMLGIAVYSIGLGFALPATNLLIVELASERQAASLNILNFCWTLGAVTAPVAIAAMLKPFGLRGFFLVVAFVSALIGAIELFAFPRVESVAPAVRNGKLASQLRLTFALLTAVFLFLYIGIENGFAGWVSAFSIRTQQTSESTTAIVQSSFWAALLFGRLLAPLILRVLRNGPMIIFGLALATIGIAISIASSSLPMLAGGVLICGFGLGPIFPTAIAVFTEWFGTGGAGSIVLGSCGLGGALVPWLVGIVSDRTDSLRLGLSVTLVCLALAALLHWRLTAVTESQPDRAASVPTL